MYIISSIVTQNTNFLCNKNVSTTCFLIMLDMLVVNAARPFSLPSHITSFTLRSRFILASLSLRSRFVLALIVTFHSLRCRFVAHSGSLPSRLVLASDSRRSRFIISSSSVICVNSLIRCSAYIYTLNSINLHLVSTIFSVPCLISTVEQALELHR